MDVQTVYMTCMIGGILLLLSSIVFSAAGDFFDFAVFDFFSIDIGEFDIVYHKLFYRIIMKVLSRRKKHST